MDSKDLITIAEGAKLCSITPQLMRYYVLEGTGPLAEKIGHAYFLERRSATAWKKPASKKKGKAKKC